MHTVSPNKIDENKQRQTSIILNICIHTFSEIGNIIETGLIGLVENVETVM